MTTETLKPCPFCGSGAELQENGSPYTGIYYVECSNPACGVEGTPSDDYHEAWRLWNRRAPQDSRGEPDGLKVESEFSQTGSSAENLQPDTRTPSGSEPSGSETDDGEGR